MSYKTGGRLKGNRGLSVADSTDWCSSLTAEQLLKAISPAPTQRYRCTQPFVFVICLPRLLNNRGISRSSDEHRSGLLPP